MIAGIAGAVVVVAVFLIAVMARASPAVATSPEAGEALAEFAARSLELESVEAVLGYAGQAVAALFGDTRAVVFVPGGDEGSWDAWHPDREQLIDQVAPGQRGLFGWFKHNPAIALRADLGQSRLGAMRGPLAGVMDAYGIDVVMPLVHEREMIGALGFALARPLSPTDRRSMRKLQIEATAACANVRLHREASYVLGLAQEADLARAAQQALVPDSFEGESGGVRWAGYLEAMGDAGSDFWAAYPLAPGKVLIAIADATGHGLAGSMVSAVVKSSCDAIVEARGAAIDPSELLAMLHRMLQRNDEKAVHMTCFAAVLDRRAGVVRYANAGHPFPYHVSQGGALSVLAGRGPVLGDAAEPRFPPHARPVARGDALVFFTDGVPGARNADRKPFGERRMQKLLLTLAGAPAPRLRESVLAALAQHRGHAPREDDAALLVVGA
jgi:serine phosphatase RsbU (regulator of sigma subunit)